MDDLDEEERNHFAAQIAWLKSAGPDDWHRAALDFNWSEPLYVLDWIVRQPDCDIATALTIFWLGEPGCFIEDDGSSDETPDGYGYLNRKMCAYIADRIASKGYTRSKIAYAATIWTKQDYDELVKEERSLDEPCFRTHPDLIRSRRGRKVTNDRDFYRRYPEDFHHSVEIEVESSKLRDFMLMAPVRLIAFKTMMRRFASSLRT